MVYFRYSNGSAANNFTGMIGDSNRSEFAQSMHDIWCLLII